MKGNKLTIRESPSLDLNTETHCEPPCHTQPQLHQRIQSQRCMVRWSNKGAQKLNGCRHRRCLEGPSGLG